MHYPFRHKQGIFGDIGEIGPHIHAAATGNAATTFFVTAIEPTFGQYPVPPSPDYSRRGVKKLVSVD